MKTLGTFPRERHWENQDAMPAPPASAKPTFDAAVRGELPVLYRVAKRLANHESDAEDLVGSALLAAAKAWKDFDGRFVRSWLVQILRNEHLMLLRKRGRRPETALEEAHEPSDEGFWGAVSWSAVGESLMRELDRIPEEYRLAVVLCDVEEMAYDEAALAMGVPVGTVRSRLFRGRRLLRARLVRCVGEDYAPEGARDTE